MLSVCLPSVETLHTSIANNYSFIERMASNASAALQW